jgi:hypothetical protein
VGDLASLLPSWRRGLDAEHKSARTVQSYGEAARQFPGLPDDGRDADRGGVNHPRARRVVHRVAARGRAVAVDVRQPVPLPPAAVPLARGRGRHRAQTDGEDASAPAGAANTAATSALTPSTKTTERDLRTRYPERQPCGQPSIHEMPSLNARQRTTSTALPASRPAATCSRPSGSSSNAIRVVTVLRSSPCAMRSESLRWISSSCARS